MILYYGITNMVIILHETPEVVKGVFVIFADILRNLRLFSGSAPPLLQIPNQQQGQTCQAEPGGQKEGAGVGALPGVQGMYS